MNNRTFALACICAVLGYFALPERAQARGIPIVFNWGDTFYAEQPIPPALKDSARGATHLSFHCQHFGVFFLTLWTWDGKWCLYNDKEDKYKELPDEVAAAALGLSGKDPGKPFFYSFPFGLFLLTVVIGGWTGYEVLKWRVNSWSAARAKRRDKPPPDEDEFDAAMAAADRGAASRSPSQSPPSQGKASRGPANPSPAADARQKQVAIEEQIAWMVGDGKAKEACQLYAGARQKLGQWNLSPKTLLALIVALDREKQHADILPLLTRYVELVPTAPTLLRLKLAQLLLTIQPRPSKALEVLDKIDVNSLDEKSKKIVDQLRTQADKLAAAEESELRLAD